MGLAASQARLLTITSRKADCEFQTMSLSHQKIALARGMERISDEYQGSLNQTKLVYDYYGSGDRNLQLSYGLMMTPSMYNDYYPKLVTDATNRVVLNSAYAAAARAAGIPREGLMGLPSSEVRNKFIQELMGNNIISPTTASTVLSTRYNQELGLGNSIGANRTANVDITYDELINMLKASELGGLNNGISNIFPTDGYWYGEGYLYINDCATKVGRESDATYTFGNVSNYTLADLLSDNNIDYTIALRSCGGELQPIEQTNFLQEALCAKDGFLNWMTDSFASVLGGTDFSDMALQYAYNVVYDIINPSGDWYSNLNYNHNTEYQYERRDWFESNLSKINNSGFDAALAKKYTLSDSPLNAVVWWDVNDSHNSIYSYYVKEADEYLGFTATRDKNHANNNTHSSQVQINLNNLAKAFLTAYVSQMEQLDSSLSSQNGSQYHWKVGKLSESSLYKSTDDFKFQIVGDTIIEDSSEDLNANFYDTMFNLICSQGWVENAKIDDKEYLAEMFKNSMMFISSINSDGFYTQGSYSTDHAVLVVPYTDAIARAEAKYNTEKAKIENKENLIDMKMRKLETEISSLTQEYDSVKGIINKSIERSIKRYDA